MEETNFQNQRTVRRRFVEAQGGAEVRRLHIVYFLSRNGCSEHPHLIRIHHHSKNGVRLRDIKRWLGEIRGKDMPESFGWSYKRKYKTGYVWQDIVDDDLVTPISDNEYVLKGSEISSTNDNLEQSSVQESAKESQVITSSQERENSDSSNYVSSNTSSSAQDSSPSFGSETSTSTDDSLTAYAEKNSDTFNQDADSSPSKTVALLKKRKTNKLDKINGNSSSSRRSSKKEKPHNRKSHSSGIFQNLISCGGVNTNDSVVTYKPLLKTCSCDGVTDSVKEKSESKAPRAVYRPLYGPNCSQCGKMFKPEKLHSHMNSCKGMKALARADNVSKISTPSRNEDSVSAYLMAQRC